MPAKNQAKDLNKVIKYEMISFEQNGKRSENVENLYQAMCAIPPTLVESERAFSAVGLFVTELRSRLGENRIYALLTQGKKSKRKQNMEKWNQGVH